MFNARDVVHTLAELMGKVTQDTVTPATVLAATQCAAQIVGLLRVHVEWERVKRMRGGRE